MNAKLSELTVGDRVKVTGFTCTEDGVKTIYEDEGMLCFQCSKGNHYLEGQLEDDGDTLVGVSHI